MMKATDSLGKKGKQMHIYSTLTVRVTNSRISNFGTTVTLCSEGLSGTS